MKPSTFIGSSKEGLPIAYQVQRDLYDTECAECTVWKQGVFGLGWGIIETLMQEIKKHDFAILIIRPDDIVISRGNPEIAAPRDNVLFELGLFMGQLGPKRAFVLYDKSLDLKILSDLQGITLADYDGEWVKRNKAAAIGAACNPIRDAINLEGFVPPNEGIVEYGSRIGLLTFDHWFVQTDMDDADYKLRVVDREKIGTWETFELIDPNDPAPKLAKKPLKFGDRIGLKGFNKIGVTQLKAFSDSDYSEFQGNSLSNCVTPTRNILART